MPCAALISTLCFIRAKRGEERERERERERAGPVCTWPCTGKIMYTSRASIPYTLCSILYTLYSMLYSLYHSIGYTVNYYRMATPPRSHLLRYVRGLESTVTTRPRNSICPEAARVESYSTWKLDAFSVCLCTVAESAESPALVSYEMSSIKINKRLLPAASACWSTEARC